MSLFEKLKAAGIEVRFRWQDPKDESGKTHKVVHFEAGKLVTETRPGPLPEKGGTWEQKRALRRKAERYMREKGAAAIGFWIDDLPADPRMHALLESVLDTAPKAVIDWRKELDDPTAYYVRVDREAHRELFDRLRELRWQRAAEKARLAGRDLPHLLEGDAFSIDGYNLVVTDIGWSSLAIALLDETGGRVTGSDLFHHVETQPPVAVSKPLPRSGRARMYLALQLVGDLEEHLASKPDPE